MSRQVGLAAVLAVVAAWNAAVLAAPAADVPYLSALTYLAGSLVCHQQPDRSFYYAGAQLPVCARCLGLYWGALLGATGWLLFAGGGRTISARAAMWLQRSGVRPLLVIAAVPTVATLALSWLGMWDAPNAVRWVLALPLGATITMVVAAVIAGDLR